MPTRILALSGSLRADSFNQKLVRVAAEGARAGGAEATVLDLREIPLPVFDEDLEKKNGLPENAKKLKDLLKSHHGLIIASPEYNSSISAALKNAIDWASRPAPGEPPLAAFAGKVAGLLAASPGALGGLRGLVHLRSILGNIGMIVLPEQYALVKAHEAFNADGTMKDEKAKSAAMRIGEAVARTAGKLVS